MTDAVAPVVLVVDDEDAIRSVLRRYLRRSGYTVLEAASGQAALDLLAVNRVAAMLLDVGMPGMSGEELLPKAIAFDSDVATIMLTGLGDPKTAISCLKLGAVDYLIKPVDLDELSLALQFALRRRELEIDRREMEQWLAREVAVRTHELEEQSRRLERLSVDVLADLVATLEAKDPLMNGHSERVGALGAAIGTRMRLEPEQVEDIRTAGRLHDVGKIALREDVLTTVSRGGAGEVGPEGREAPELAARILRPLEHLAGVVEIVRLQHERYDGHGYPEGLRGEEIPIGARIMAAANIYDELVAASARQPALTPAEALESLRGSVGMRLDPVVFDVLGEVVGTS